MRSRVLRRARCAVLQVKDPRWGRAQPAGSCSCLLASEFGEHSKPASSQTQTHLQNEMASSVVSLSGRGQGSAALCAASAPLTFCRSVFVRVSPVLYDFSQIRTSGKPGTIRGRGRRQEVYSEDPALTSALTVGYVTGIQGSQCVCRPALPPSPRVCDPRPSVCLPPVHVTCPLC